MLFLSENGYLKPFEASYAYVADEYYITVTKEGGGGGHDYLSSKYRVSKGEITFKLSTYCSL